MPWKNTLLKNPEQGILLGWKGMERRRGGMHERIRGGRWREAEDPPQMEAENGARATDPIHI